MLFRSRDCLVYHYGDRVTVGISNQLVGTGWSGGQGVQWGNDLEDRLLVTGSDGLFGGFLVWGSDEKGDLFTSMTRNQLAYRQATMFYGGCIMATSTYERYTYASRTGGGPLVAIVYAPNDPLYLSTRGWWTKEDEMALRGDPRAPALSCGFVSVAPKDANGFYLTIQTSML